jgi:hypothetical protein
MKKCLSCDKGGLSPELERCCECGSRLLCEDNEAFDDVYSMPHEDYQSMSISDKITTQFVFLNRMIEGGA